MRKNLVKCLVGSHNYNLQTPTSDKDWKQFILPTFDDLYNGTMYSRQTVGETEDVDVHDIRKFPMLMWKANINFIEALHSSEIRYNLTDYEIREIFKLADDIAKMNLPYLFNACIGMHKEKIGRLDKASEGTTNLILSYGYNTKEALHSYRCLDFLELFCNLDFTDFKSAMRYTLKENIDFMLGIKHGNYTKEEFMTIIGNKYNHIIDKYRAIYMFQKPNEELKQHIEELVFKLVKNHIVGVK